MLCAGRPTEEDLRLIRTRKPDIPKLPVTFNDGTKRELWCTFGPQQIDIDVMSPQGAHLVCMHSYQPPMHRKLCMLVMSFLP